MALNRTQKRLLWVLKNYGERDPITALYTWVVASKNFERASPFGGIPSLDQLLRHAVKTSPGPPIGPTLQSPQPELVRWALGYAHARTETGRWNDTGCAKMIPAVARWIAVTRAESEGLGEGNRSWTNVLFLRRVAELQRELQYLCDWYLGDRPDLGAFRTFQSALDAAVRWHSNLERAQIKLHRGMVVYEWPDGWFVTELRTWQMFVQEGRALGHCVGQGREYWDAYTRGDANYYSMRRPDGQPWFTIEVDAPDLRSYRRPFNEPRVAQIKGCKNRLPAMHARSRDCPPPDPTECTRLWQFLSATDWLVGTDYAPCWAFAAAAKGLPKAVQMRDPSDFPADQLIKPPSPVEVPEGKWTDDFDVEWWTERRPTRA